MLFDEVLHCDLNSHANSNLPFGMQFVIGAAPAGKRRFLQQKPITAVSHVDVSSLPMLPAVHPFAGTPVAHRNLLQACTLAAASAVFGDINYDCKFGVLQVIFNILKLNISGHPHARI